MGPMHPQLYRGAVGLACSQSGIDLGARRILRAGRIAADIGPRRPPYELEGHAVAAGCIPTPRTRQC
jgi:hypothetical protein